MKKMAPDKWKHFFVGIVMGAVLQGFFTFLLADHFILATILALVLVLAISYGFELFSKVTGMGHYDFIDAIASAIGGVVGMAVTMAIQINL